MNYTKVLIYLLTIFSLMSCGKEGGGSGSSSGEQKLDCSNESLAIAESRNDVSNKVIIGDELNWYSRDQIDDLNQRANSLAVGQIYLPAQLASCTAFLINENTIITNHHCVNRASDLKNSKFNLYDKNENRVSYNCHSFLSTKPSLDYTLIKCDGEPGKKHGYLYLDEESPVVNSDIYVVQENCNYIDEPYCDIDRFISYGDIVEMRGSRITHLADTLPGSSGSPILSMDSHKVVALHNAGSISGDEGANFGIPMTKIVKNIRDKHPNLKISTQLNSRVPRAIGDNQQGCE